MAITETNFDLNAFLQTVSAAPARILMLDYDGTLAPFHVERHLAVPYPGVRDTLNDIISVQRTRLVVVSGRSIRDLISLLGLVHLPELYGSHGGEYLALDGEYHRHEMSDSATAGVLHAVEWAHENNLASVLEKKPCGVAFHWRGLSSDRISEIEREVGDFWSERVTASGLELHRFDGGLEIRPRGIDKGAIVDRILKDATAATVAAYLGDDLTDEDAFKAIRGRGVSVLVGPIDRETSADVRIEPPGQLLTFLRKWA